MAYDQRLAERLNRLIKTRHDIHALKMFGGIGYLLRGNMCFGIWKDSLILRLGVEQASQALKQKEVKPFDITGRAMKGWVMVSPGGIRTGASLNKWVILAVAFVSTLPRK